MKKVSKNQAKELINSSKGKIFSVTFTKKNGETREMICRKGVKKYLKGGELMFNPNEKGLAVVFDMKKNAYRMININTLEKIVVDKTAYSVEQVVQHLAKGKKMIIEKNREGAIVIFGDIGRRIYYYYSKKEAIQKYKNELKRKK